LLEDLAALANGSKYPAALEKSADIDAGPPPIRPHSEIS
jgi:hypothetical protein